MNYLTDEDQTYTQEALELLNRLYNVDKSHMDMAEMTATSSSPVPMFETGNVAMMINGAWGIGQLDDDTKSGANNVNWDMTYLPTPDGVAPKTTAGGISYIGINANSANPDASWKFIEFMVDCQVLKFGEFTLKSGRKISVFYECRRLCDWRSAPKAGGILR